MEPTLLEMRNAYGQYPLRVAADQAHTTKKTELLSLLIAKEGEDKEKAESQKRRCEVLSFAVAEENLIIVKMLLNGGTVVKKEAYRDSDKLLLALLANCANGFGIKALLSPRNEAHALEIAQNLVVAGVDVRPAFLFAQMYRCTGVACSYLRQLALSPDEHGKAIPSGVTSVASVKEDGGEGEGGSDEEDGDGISTF